MIKDSLFIYLCFNNWEKFQIFVPFPFFLSNFHASFFFILFNHCPPGGRKGEGETRVEFVRSHEQVIGTAIGMKFVGKVRGRLSPLLFPIHFSFKGTDKALELEIRK